MLLRWEANLPVAAKENKHRKSNWKLREEAGFCSLADNILRIKPSKTHDHGHYRRLGDTQDQAVQRRWRDGPWPSGSLAQPPPALPSTSKGYQCPSGIGRGQWVPLIIYLFTKYKLRFYCAQDTQVGTQAQRWKASLTVRKSAMTDISASFSGLPSPCFLPSATYSWYPGFFRGLCLSIKGKVWGSSCGGAPASFLLARCS